MMIGGYGSNYSTLINGMSALSQSTQRLYAQLSSALQISTYAASPSGGMIADSIELNYNSLLAEIETNEQALSQLQTTDSVASTVQSNLAQIQTLQIQAAGYADNPHAVAAIQAEIDDLIAATGTALEPQLANGAAAFEAGEKLQAVLDDGVDATDDPQALLEASAEVSLQQVDIGSQAAALESTIRSQNSHAIGLGASHAQVAALDYAVALVEQMTLDVRRTTTIHALGALFDVEAQQVSWLTAPPR